MQFNFWRFTSDTGTNLLIAIAICFVLLVMCNKCCSRNQKVHPIVYIGHLIASVGMGIYFTFGFYSGMIGPVIGMIGFLIAGCLGYLTKDPDSYQTREPPRYITSGAPRYQTRESLERGPQEPVLRCPYCSCAIYMRNEIVNPDGSVRCPNCRNNFIPMHSETIAPPPSTKCPHCSYPGALEDGEVQPSGAIICPKCKNQFFP